MNETSIDESSNVHELVHVVDQVDFFQNNVTIVVYLDFIGIFGRIKGVDN